MTQRVVLISPPTRSGRDARGDYFTPPMGLCYLGAVLEEQGFNVDIVDCDCEGILFPPSDQEAAKSYLADRLRSKQAPVCVGIGPVTTPFLPSAIWITEMCAELFPNTSICLGGPHVSASPPDYAIMTLENMPEVSAVVIGEGEYAFADLVTKLANDTEPYGQGVVLRQQIQDGRSFYKPSHSPANLDELPFPARHLLDRWNDKYRLAIRRSAAFVSEDEPGYELGIARFAVVFTSRGCPFQCTYCASSKIRRIRAPQMIVEEIADCVYRRNVRSIVFYDDLFTLATEREKARVKDLCNLIRQQTPEITWQVELRADVVSELGPEILEDMWNAGCRAINMGIEKGYQRGLDQLKKDMSIEQIVTAVSTIRQVGDYNINGTFIIGGPEETETMARSTIDFASSLKLDYAAFYPLEIHPGTKLFSLAEELGIVFPSWEQYSKSDRTYPLFVTEHLTRDDLVRLCREGFRQFYYSPEYILSRLQGISSMADIQAMTDEYHHYLQDHL